jgi:outer membrane protein assembly factor BamE (lipoprotein component of BamABCDE complex)
MKANFNRHFAAGAFTLCFFFGLCGCASNTYESGTPMSADKISQIKKGVTTRAEVEALLGPPDFVSLVGDGKRVMSYHYSSTQTEAHATAATFIPYAGLFVGGAKGQSQTHTQTLQVILNAANVVQDYEFDDNTGNTAIKSGGGLFAPSTSSTTSTVDNTASAAQK